MAAGCASPSGLQMARMNFYLGRVQEAEANLKDLPPGETSRVLALMERGLTRQTLGKYRDAARDWQDAVAIAEQLDYVSLSKGTASFLVNDRALAYRGAPYERTLLHAFNAKNYFALAQWDEAAVEARNIVKRLQALQGFPDDAYSRYLAAVCYEIIGDSGDAAMEYKKVGKLLPHLRIDETTGRIDPPGAVVVSSAPPSSPAPSPELLCFVLIGRSPPEHEIALRRHALDAAPYAEIRAGGKCLGRSYAFSNTENLLTATEEKLAALKLAKTVTRVALKETLAESVERKNQLLGELLRVVLFSMEQPDNRRWETLPMWLEVARVPCPPDLKEFKVLFKDASGRTRAERTVAAPLSRARNTFISFCRE